MDRTRAALLAGALAAVAERGVRRTTMQDIATSSGVAKATLYNHFRTKDDVLAALVQSEVLACADRCTGLPLVEALAVAACTISEHAVVRQIAKDEPGVLTALLCAPAEAAGWQAARASVRAALPEAGHCDDLVLRWLISFLIRPGTESEVRRGAAGLAAGS